MARCPFTARSAWLDIETECPDLRHTHKTLTKIKDVLKGYLNTDGLLLVPRNDPLVRSSELIIVPRSVLDGLVTALHIKLDHPSKHQLILVMKRHFHAIDLAKAVDSACYSCHICASLQKHP